MILVVHMTDKFPGTKLISDPILELIQKNNEETHALAIKDPGHTNFGKFHPSSAGEFDMDIGYKDVIICGLYFKACVSTTIKFASTTARSISLPTTCIASGTKRTLEDQRCQNYPVGFLQDYIFPFLTNIIDRPFDLKMESGVITIKFA